jgi:hypothetical protein
MFRATRCLSAALLLLAAPASHAGVITFETLPDGVTTPTDNAPLTQSYTIDGVTLTFDLLVNGLSEDPVFEATGDYSGDPGFAFVNASIPTPTRDTPMPGFESQLGGWFIRPLALGTELTLIITYTSVAGPVTAASGEIWDIDAVDETATEQWAARAYDGSDTLLATLLSPEGISTTAPLDALPWTFQFTGLTDIRRIELEFVGTRESGIGLAFNNFSPITAIPEPGSVALLTSALLLLGLTRRRAD